MIRPIEEKDLEALTALEARAGDVGWGRLSFEKELTGEFGRFFVIEESSMLIGYGGYWTVDQEAQVTNLVIAPEYRRQGWASRLLAFFMDCARSENCTRFTLEVRSQNLPAQALYHKEGFQEIARRAKAYERPKDSAIIMEKKL